MFIKSVPRRQISLLKGLCSCLKLARCVFSVVTILIVLLYSHYTCYRFIRSITVLTSTAKSHCKQKLHYIHISFTKITDNIWYACGNRWLDYKKSITQLLHWGRSQLNPVHSRDIVFITLVPGFNYTLIPTFGKPIY